MADPIKNTPPAGEPDPAQIKRIMIPTVAIGVVIVLVAVITSMSGGGSKKMSDGSDGSAEDSGLKEVTAGLKIRDLKEGTGDPVLPGSRVKVHYTGWLTDGSVFDTSKEKGKQPVEFSLEGVIAGWTQGIPGMKKGGIRKLVIAPELGYGSRRQNKIPENSTLIFEVELLEDVPVVFGPGKPMSDGSDGGTSDPGLKDIGDGLKIRDLKEGTGDAVKPGASVTVHYTGWTVNGNVFDSSKKTGNPVTFSLDGVVKGWGKGIPGMKPGGIRKLVIPAALGYGEQGSPPNIPAGATLIFEVELVK